ncbi:hypothetical protein ABG067_005901 [Albugo candida]
MALLSQLIQSCEKYSILEAVLCLTEQLFKQKHYSIREDTMLYFIQLLEISANNFFGCPENFQMSDVIGNKLLEITAVCNIVDLDTSSESNVRLSIFLWKVSFYRRTHSNSHFADQNFTRIGNISVKHKEIAKLLPVNQNIFIETRRQLTKFCEQLQRYILSSTDCQDEKCIQLHQTLPKCSIPTHDVLQSRLKLTRFLHRAFHKQILNHLEFSSQSLIQLTEIFRLSDALTLLATSSLIFSQWNHVPEMTQDSHHLLEAVLDSVSQISSFHHDPQTRVSNSVEDLIPFLQNTFSYPAELLRCSAFQPLLKLALALVNGNMSVPSTKLKDVMDDFRDCFPHVFSMEMISYESQQDLYIHAVDTILTLLPQADSEPLQHNFQIEIFRYTLDDSAEMRRFCWLLWKQLLSIWESDFSSQMSSFLVGLATCAPLHTCDPPMYENELTGSIFVQRMQELVIFLMDATTSPTNCLPITEKAINHICKLGPQHEFSANLAYQLQFMENFVTGNCLSFVNAKEKDEWIKTYLPICLECIGALLDLTTDQHPVNYWPGILRVFDISTLVLLSVTLESDEDELAFTILPLCLELLKVLADCVKEEKRLQNHPTSRCLSFQLSVDLCRPFSSSQRLIQTCLSIIARSKLKIQCNQDSNFVRLLANVHTLLTIGNAKVSVTIATFLQKVCADVQVDEMDLPIVNQLIARVVQSGYSQSPLMQTIWLDTILHFARQSNLLDAKSSTFIHYFIQHNTNGRYTFESFLNMQQLPWNTIRKNADGVLARKRPRSTKHLKLSNPFLVMENQLETMLATCKKWKQHWDADNDERDSIQENVKKHRIEQKVEELQKCFSKCV